MIYAEGANYLIEIGADEDYRKGFYHCYLKLNSLSFGYATNTFWKFRVQYNAEFAHWNFQKPTLPQYYQTPRSVLSHTLTRKYEIAPKMLSGYSSKDMQKFKDPSFPDGFLKLSWDYPCPHIDSETKYVHPGGDLILPAEDIELLYGCSVGQVPPNIKDYLAIHVLWFENKSWGEQNFSASYDKFVNKWSVEHYKQKVFIKEYNFMQYTPSQVCPESDRYPMVSTRKR